ncbi:MAG TPA: hypothetical protein VGL35_08470 [Rhizomicrobium sp.]|jgi:hypothetical protein
MIAPRERVDSRELLEAGLASMERCGKPLTRMPTKGRAMLYTLTSGESVRVRTCNDHVLIVVGDTPAPHANLNIQGTDWLLLVMPEIERTRGKVVAYLIPAAEAEAEARCTHADWLRSNPNTKGDNRTWNLWFRSDGPEKASNYAAKWAKYLLPNSVDLGGGREASETEKPRGVKDEVEISRRRVAAAAGVPVEAVKITIDFGG